MGVGQRLISGGAHVGGVIVVEGADRVRDILLPVYEAMGLDWRPEATGAVADEAPGVTVDDVIGALRDSFAGEYSLEAAGSTRRRWSSRGGWCRTTCRPATSPRRGRVGRIDERTREQHGRRAPHHDQPPDPTHEATTPQATPTSTRKRWTRAARTSTRPEEGTSPRLARGSRARRALPRRARCRRARPAPRRSPPGSNRRARRAGDPGRHGGPQPLHHHDRRLGRMGREDERELLAAVAGEDVRGPESR